MDLQRKNSSIDDICAVIGFTATMRLITWFGSKNSTIFVPAVADPSHQLGIVIGMAPFQRLVGAFGRQIISIPENYWRTEADVRDRWVFDMVEARMTLQQMATETGLSERRIMQIVRKLEQSGLIPVVAPVKNSSEKSQGKTYP